MVPIARQEIKIRKAPFYFIVSVFILIIFITYEERKFYEVAYLLMIAGLLLFLILYFALSKSKIIIDNSGIEQQLFFGKQKELKWDDIKSSSFNWHFHEQGANLDWEFIGYSGNNLLISPPFYSRKQLRIIADSLIEKCPNAIIDKRIIQISEGQFPWYIF